MLQLSANVIAAMQKPTALSFLMVRITDDVPTVYVNSTSHTNGLTLSNGWSYLSDGLILAADPPRLSTVVDREAYNLNFADPTRIMGSITNWVGKNVDVRIGFYDDVGAPYTNLADTLLIYAGTVDGAGYKFKVGQNGESTFQLVCTSPLADLDHTKFIYLSRDFIRSRNINDTCCDTINAGSAGIALKWGRT